jgi:hypothetical protein
MFPRQYGLDWRLRLCKSSRVSTLSPGSWCAGAVLSGGLKIFVPAPEPGAISQSGENCAENGLIRRSEHDINIQAFFAADRMTILFAPMLLLLPQRLLSQQIQPLQLFQGELCRQESGCHRAERAGGHCLQRQAFQTPTACRSQRLLLCVDRNHGKILLAKPFLRRADRASGIGAALSQPSTLCALSTQKQARSAHGSCRKYADKFHPFVQSANLLEA